MTSQRAITTTAQPLAKGALPCQRSTLDRCSAMLGVGSAEMLLDYYTSSACRPLHILKTYVRDVVFGGESPRTWRRGRVLTPWLSLEEVGEREHRQGCLVCAILWRISAPAGAPEWRWGTCPTRAASQHVVSWRVEATVRASPGRTCSSPRTR